MEFVKDRVALIGGDGDAITEVTAARLAGGGAKIAIAGTKPDSVNSLASKTTAQGAESIAIALQSSNKTEVQKAVTEVLDRFGKIDILVNGFSEAGGKAIANVTDQDWESSLQINLSTPFLFCREVIPHMRANKYGRIINLSSFNYLGWPGTVNYSAATSGLFGFTRSLALELAKDDIMVNCVVKGDILTAEAGWSEEEAAKLANSQPVKRLGGPEDVARVVAFFASDTSKYVTGQTLFVCGGKSVYCSMSA